MIEKVHDSKYEGLVRSHEGDIYRFSLGEGLLLWVSLKPENSSASQSLHTQVT